MSFLFRAKELISSLGFQKDCSVFILFKVTRLRFMENKGSLLLHFVLFYDVVIIVRIGLWVPLVAAATMVTNGFFSTIE